MGINKGTVLDLINDVHKSGGFKDYNSYSYLFDQVDMMPESEEDIEPHWIPVTERLPENDEDVLVQMDDDSMMVDFRSASSNGWFWAEIGDEPLAWMPLPEPYKGVTE